MTSPDQAAPSPFSVAGPRVREQGFRPLPILPIVGMGSPGRGKAPGACEPMNGSTIPVWNPMEGWQEWAEKDQPEELIDHWATYPNANVGVLMDRTIGSVDIDVDEPRVQAAVMALFAELDGEIVKKAGGKGFTVFFRQPDAGPVANASYSYADGERAADLLSLGRQTVIPPSEHVTGKRYRWLTLATLENVAVEDLPQVGEDFPELLQEALRPLKIFRGGGSRAKVGSRSASSTQGAGQEEIDLDPQTDVERESRGWMSAINVRAMQPSEMRKWAPALGLPKFQARGSGHFRAVASWRSSSTGRDVSQRSPNLGISPKGIEDFGTGEKLTPIDLVQRALDLERADEAADWLTDIMDADFVITPDVLAMAKQGEVRASDGGLRVIEGDKPEMTADDTPEGSQAASGSENAAPALSVIQGSGISSMIDFEESEELELGDDQAMEFRKAFPREVPPFPLDLVLELSDGLLADLAEYLGRATTTVWQAGGYAAAISFLGAAYGRHYANPTNIRTNLFLVLMATSGGGKGRIVGALSDLVRYAGDEAAGLVGAERIMSDSGLVNALEYQPRVVYWLDEFGHMLKAMSDPRAPTHQKKIVQELTKLYSKSGGVYEGSAYANDDPKKITDPHVCVLGMSTERQWWEAFGSGATEDGTLARYMLIQARDRPKVKRANDTTGRGELAKRIAKAVEPPMDQVKALAAFAGARTVPWADENVGEYAFAIQEECQRMAHMAEDLEIPGAPSIISRIAENAQKIALINAISRDHERPVITMRDQQLGWAFASWSAQTMIAEIDFRVADTETGRKIKKVEHLIHKAGKNGLAHTKLLQSLKGDVYADELKNKIIPTLVEAGKVGVAKVATGGKKMATLYAHREWRRSAGRLGIDE